MDDKTTTTQTAATGGKTFTQAELDAAIESRLTRERAKFADYEALKAKADKFDKAEEAAKSELQKAQEQAAAYKAQLDAKTRELAAAAARSKVSSETGVPANLLTGETEEACKAQAEALHAWRGGVRSVPNRSVDHMLAESRKTTPKDEFEAGLLKMAGELFPDE